MRADSLVFYFNDESYGIVSVSIELNSVIIRLETRKHSECVIVSVIQYCLLNFEFRAQCTFLRRYIQ